MGPSEAVIALGYEEQRASVLGLKNNKIKSVLCKGI